MVRNNGTHCVNLYMPKTIINERFTRTRIRLAIVRKIANCKIKSHISVGQMYSPFENVKTYSVHLTDRYRTKMISFGESVNVRPILLTHT